jgi:hypothetical protein
MKNGETRVRGQPTWAKYRRIEITDDGDTDALNLLLISHLESVDLIPRHACERQ